MGPAAVVVACSDDDTAPAVSVDAGTDASVLGLDVTPGVDTGADVADARPACAPLAATGHAKLSETGLYEDIGAKQVACDVIPFEPEFKLWSDAAEKKRWVRLPPGTTIDTTDPDHWVLPVGAQLFKEFSLNGKRLETRLVERVGGTGQPSKDYFLGAFAWNDDESDADFVAAGAENVRGTPHDVPAAGQCLTCHLGEPGRALGFSALQLSHDGVLEDLHARGFLAALEPKRVPGSDRERSALGYLHANCGHCHNVNGSAWPDTQMVLRVGYGETSVTDTLLFESTVGVALQNFSQPGVTKRIVPGDPDASCVAYRPAVRGDAGAMPPIATELTDDAGVAVIRAWIASLDAGAP